MPRTTGLLLRHCAFHWLSRATGLMDRPSLMKVVLPELTSALRGQPTASCETWTAPTASGHLVHVDVSRSVVAAADGLADLVPELQLGVAREVLWYPFVEIDEAGPDEDALLLQRLLGVLEAVHGQFLQLRIFVFCQSVVQPSYGPVKVLVALAAIHLCDGCLLQLAWRRSDFPTRCLPLAAPDAQSSV